MACWPQILCLIACLIVFIVVAVVAHSSSSFVSRQDWGALPATQVDPIEGPVPYVIIHHSYIPSVCWTTETCIEAMRSMQLFHQKDRGWNDIGYSFGVGGDGKVYEGRGFNVVGAHAPRYNDKSVGICVIGDWTIDLPPDHVLGAIHRIIKIGVDKGYIQSNYTLLGHRQVRATECPGERLFNEIKTWEHFENLPVFATSKPTTVDTSNS